LDEKYKYYTYKPSEKYSYNHFWLYEYVGYHFCIRKASSFTTIQGPEKFWKYYIQEYSEGHISNIPAYDFLISMGIIL